MMGVPESPKPPHLYPQALQLKLYQAFIFSIPILFSIILLLLVYLFYLKRRSTSSTLHPPLTHRPTTTYSVSSTSCQLDLKMEIDDELSTVLFDEELRRKDSLCCVCLGEFVTKEELLQVPSCKHIFHTNCIHLWLHTNNTCPLCRCSILLNNIPSKRPPPQPAPNASEPPPLPVTLLPNQSQQIASLEPQQEEHQPSSSSIYLTRLPREGSIVIHIQTHGSNHD